MTAPLVTDLAIVGSGFGGSILAMIARRLGYSVALLERGRHPRFAIGESASPLLGVVLEQLAARYDLPRLAPLAAFGTWQRQYPHVTCGLKRGFTYYRHETRQRFAATPDRPNELLVAASPSDELSDTHWLRADVDAFLAHEAVDLGATYIDDLALAGVEWRASGRALLTGLRHGADVRVEAHHVIDATGPRGFLSRALSIPSAGFDGYPGTQALFSHFTGVARCAAMPEFESADTPPYPPDDAALHHVFDGGWMWVLRFGNGITSAGVAVVDDLAAELRLGDGEPAWHRLLARFPSIRDQFADAQAIREFTWMPRIAGRASAASGEGWTMLPSAAGFVDPLFSTGMPLTLLGVERIARWLESAAGPSVPRDATRVPAYEDTTFAELDHVARFVAGCYAGVPRFEQFTAFAMFYFAAASFSEMSRRLHGDTWSRGFLMAGDPEFVAAMRELSPSSGRPTLGSVARAIDRVNVAGLAMPTKRNWYGVDVEETAAAASKLGVTPERVRALFAAT